MPPKPDTPPHAAFAAAKPGQARLSKSGRPNPTRSLAPQAAALEQSLAEVKSGRKGNVKKWVTTGAVVVVLGAGGYLGYPYAQAWLAKRSEAANQASGAAAQQDASASAAEPAPAEPPAPAPEKELPLIPPLWTLDVDKAAIPEARANGMICGTNFVVETARLDQVGPTCLLQLVQGAAAAPDRAFLIYLRPNAGEGVTGRTFTVSQDMRGRAVPQLVKVWKTNPRYQAQRKTISSGYAMKLELGQITNGTITGKIYLAVPPENEQSVVAGVFKATTSLADATGATAANPAPSPGTEPAPAPPPSAEPANFQQRYGVKR